MFSSAFGPSAIHAHYGKIKQNEFITLEELNAGALMLWAEEIQRGRNFYLCVCVCVRMGGDVISR